MSHGHQYKRAVQEQGKWLPFQNKIPNKIKIQVVILIAFVCLLVYFISKSQATHHH